jgi:hypothetical protein
MTKSHRRLPARTIIMAVLLLAGILCVSIIYRAYSHDKNTTAEGNRPPRKPRLTIGKDTTYVAGPLDKDGYINYQAALNERLSKGVTPENNACVMLWNVFGPPRDPPSAAQRYFEPLGMPVPPAKGDYFIGVRNFAKDYLKIEDKRERDELDHQLTRAMERPWTAQDHPRIAAWLEESEKTLALAIEATKKPRYFSPRDDRYLMLNGSSLQVSDCHDLAEAFAARALLRVKLNGLDDAWQDLLACHRLGRLLAQNGASQDWLVAIMIDNIASEAGLAWVSSDGQDAKRIKNALRDLQTLPRFPNLADSVDVSERFAILDHIQRVSRYGLPYLEEHYATGKLKAPTEFEKQLLEDVDWDRVMRKANRWHDRIAAALRQEDYRERTRQLKRFADDFKALYDRVSRRRLIDAISDAKDKTEIVGDVSLRFFLKAYYNLQVNAERTTQERRNLQIAFALAAYQRENGKYPATLDALAPKYVAKVPNDLFTDKPLVYQPSEKGYLLYSLGPNGKDDAGHGPDDDPKGDDLSLRMPLPRLNDKSGK